MAFSLAQATKISTWGNSDAVRIPRQVLKAVGLASGDSVNVVVNERNNIEIVRKKGGHRCVKPAKGITFESLFTGYDLAKATSTEAWPNEGMIGAEFEAWSR